MSELSDKLLENAGSLLDIAERLKLERGDTVVISESKGKVSYSLLRKQEKNYTKSSPIQKAYASIES